MQSFWQVCVEHEGVLCKIKILQNCLASAVIPHSLNSQICLYITVLSHCCEVKQMPIKAGD